MNTKRIVTGRHDPAKRQAAQRLRKEMTPAESLLWKRLRDGQQRGLRFRRQQIIDGFIADFYCHVAGLVIEVDGSVHDHQEEYDRQRDSVLAARGLRILRFSNDRIEQEIDAVLAEIVAVVQSSLSNQWKR